MKTFAQKFASILAILSMIVPVGFAPATALAASPTLTVAGGGTGTGTVTTVDGFINCTITAGVTSGSCSHIYAANFSSKILTATAASGSTFTPGWSGTGGCTGTGTCSASQTGNGTFNAIASFTLNAPVVTTATLTLVKNLIKDNNGTGVATDWTLSATGPTNISGVTGNAAVTAAVVNAGTYTLAENGGPAGYSASNWSCTNGVTVTASQITLAGGQTTTCTITNNDIDFTNVNIAINTINGESAESSFSCPNDLGTSVTVAGSGSLGTNPPGQTSAYGVDVDWGDNTAHGNIFPIPVSGANNAFTFSFGPHTYAASFSGTVTARVYHQNINGQDGNGESHFSVAICINPPVTTGTITITKVAETETAVFDFTENIDLAGLFQIDMAQGPSRIFNDVEAGQYTVTESDEAGWDFSNLTCNDENSTTDGTTATINLEAGESITCTYTNTVEVVVENPQCSDEVNNDGEEDALVDFPNDPGCTDANDNDETDPVVGDTQCSDGVDNADAEDELADEADPQCSNPEDNNEGPDMCPDLLGDQVTDDLCSEGGGDSEPTAWIEIVKQTPNSYGTFDVTVDGGSTNETRSISTGYAGDYDSESFGIFPSISGTNYTISEEMPSGWEFTSLYCEYESYEEGEEAGVALTNGSSINVEPGENVTCTFVNTATTGFVKVIKNVINDDGEDGVPSDFTLKVIQSGDQIGTAIGSEDGVFVSVPAGAYNVMEEELDNYEASYSEDCSGEVVIGEVKICTVTNDDSITDGTSSGSEANDNGGSVLGASIETGLSCSFLTYAQLTSIKNGVNADPAIVTALQEWLNSSQNAGLTVNGKYDAATKLAIMHLQEKYSAEVLAPWGQIKATGNVWKTTSKLILRLVCGENVDIGALVPFVI